MAAQLAADVLRDEVDGHQVVTTLPGDDDVRVAAAKLTKITMFCCSPFIGSSHYTQQHRAACGRV
jgi:hypothetical protein